MTGARRPQKARAALQVTRTSGDFPHARHRGTQLMCGATTCTCCCLVFAGAGLGTVGGLIMGITAFAKRKPDPNIPETPSQEIDIGHALVGIIRFLGYALGYAIAGLLMGAAIGAAADFLFGTAFF